ncbi:hypothetical protein DFQ26_008490 [Actinomortierella ambigua]|nr:hypothetical protein DFQ26_008490 [Actinomortierella ambigua]
MLHQTPLAIPELRLLVASFLDYDDVKTCAMVCRAWHRDLQPIVWRHLTVNMSKHHKTCTLMKTARMDSIRKNARWIRDFRHMVALGSIVIPELYDILFDHCRSLLAFEARILYDDEWHVLKKLIKLNTGLRQVDLLFTASPWLLVADLQLPSILHAHPQLRTFRTNYSMTVSMLLCILHACPSLEDVRAHIEHSPPWLLDPDASDGDGKEIKSGNHEASYSPTTMTMTRLRRLELGGACDDPDLSVLLERSPMLQHLHLASLPVHVLVGVYRALRAHGPTYLTSLVTDIKKGLPSPLGALVQALPSHQLCDVKASSLEAQEIRMLVGLHHASLENVRLHIGPGAQEAIVDLLSQCSRLKTLVVTTTGFAIDARSLVGRGPWACSELELLHLPIGSPRPCRNKVVVRSVSIEEGDDEEHEHVSRSSPSPVPPALLPSCCGHQEERDQARVAFMKSLGCLTKLRGLNLELDHGYRKTAFSEAWPWTLSWNNGLMHLARLAQMKSLDVGDCQPNVQGNFSEL